MQLNFTDLELQISNLIEERINSLKTEFEELLASEDRYLTRQECAEYCSVSISTVDNMVKRGLPKYKLGKSTRFLKSEVDQFIRESNSYNFKTTRLWKR